MSTIDQPTFRQFRRDWAQGAAAGFDEVNDGSDYSTPTDCFLKGMARDFELQRRGWDTEMAEMGLLEHLYDENYRKWRYVTPDEAVKIRESNKEEDEYQAKRTAKAKAKRDNKWYRKIFKRGAKK